MSWKFALLWAYIINFWFQKEFNAKILIFFSQYLITDQIIQNKSYLLHIWFARFFLLKITMIHAFFFHIRFSVKDFKMRYMPYFKTLNINMLLIHIRFVFVSSIRKILRLSDTLKLDKYITNKSIYQDYNRKESTKN